MIKGSINGISALFFANFLGKIIGAIYRIPLSNYLGAEGIGLYQMAFPIYSFLLTFITGGVSVSLSKKVASERARGNEERARYHFFVAKKLCFIFGLIFLIVLIIFAYPLSILQGNVNAVWGYFAISIGFIFACLLGAYRGYYQGYSNMVPTAISQIIEQVSKLILGLLFTSILIKYGIIYGVFGALLGVSLSEIISYIFFVFKHKRIAKLKNKVKLVECVSFFKYSLPVSISFGIMPLSSLLDSFLIVNLLTLSGFTASYATSLYGLEAGMILPLINMPNVLISAIAISTLPDISYKKENREDVTSIVNGIIKSVYIIVLPCCVGLFFLSQNIISIIYPNLSFDMLRIASQLLKLSVFEMFFMCFVSVTNSILQALGKERLSMYFLILGIIIKTCLTFVLVCSNSINISGLIIASTFGYFLISMLNIIKIKQLCCFRLNLLELISPIIACFIMSIILYIGINLILSFNIGKLVLLIFICALVYFGTLFITKQLNIKTIKNFLKGKV